MLKLHKIVQTLTQEIRADDELALTWELRTRSRLRTRTIAGREAGIVLDRGSQLRDGTLLRSTEGYCVQVTAAPEPVVTAATTDSHRFARACYHLGNRHVPLQIGNGWLRFQPDHVLEEMVTGLGLSLQKEKAAFEPESGAYHSSHAHTHSHPGNTGSVNHDH